jgi:alpha-mannosidase
MFTLILAVMLPVVSLSADNPDTPEPQPKIGVVGTAHLDTQWRWTIKNTIEEYIPNTLHDNFKLLDLYPDYVFSFEAAFRYMLAKEYYPEDYARLKQYVADGRWRVTGSWVDAVDVNLPSFESLTRHALYGNGFYKQEFGKQSYDIFLPDCFGFGYALPSIAHHCGLKSFSTQKLTWGCSVPVPFFIGEWQGVDGSTVVAALKPGDYVSTIHSDLSRDTLWTRMADEQGVKTGAYLAYMYFGTGDVGGAPESLSVDWLQKSIRGGGPMKVASVGADDLPKLVAEYPGARLKRYNGELLMTRHGAGCYTSQAAMKRWNRKNEQLADAAERAAVTAAMLGGYTYPKATLREAWVRFLWHQFHDDLTGTSIPEAYEYSWSDELLSLNQFSSILSDAVSAVTPVLDTRGKGKTVVVYNPLAMEREEVVESTTSYPVVQVIGPDGKEVPSQVIPGPEREDKLLFLARAPSVGFAVYDVREARKTSPARSGVTASVDGLENSRYKVSLNRNGDVASIYDKSAKKELLASPIEWQLIFDKPRRWPAWEIQYEDIVAGAREVVGGTPRIDVIETGPVRGAIKITRQLGKSTYEMLIRVAGGSAGDRIEFVNYVDWQEKEALLKAAFKLSGANDSVTYDLGLGVIKRGLNAAEKYEVPGQMWADQTARDGSYGVAILNDCKYGWDHPDDQTLRLTLVHTPGVSDGWKWVGDQSSMDIGKHSFIFAVMGHVNSLGTSEVPWQAARLNQPMRVFEVPHHSGKSGKSCSLLQVSNANQVMINAVKMAEYSDELIIRVRELQGKPADNVTISFGRHLVSAREVNGQEEEIGKALSEKDKLTISLTPFQPKAFAVRLGQPRMTARPLMSQTIALPYDLDGISLDDDRTDGNIDGEGNSLAGELLPQELVYDGVKFRFGPESAGAMNVVTCSGQQIALPKGDWKTVHMLMLATGGPVLEISKTVDSKSAAAAPISLQDYTERIGQWNNRMVNGRMVSDAAEILPAFVNHSPVAWAGTHRHTADGKNETYKFTYLYAVRVELGPGAERLTLPDNPRLKLLAASVADDARDQIVASAALYDEAGLKFARIAPDQTAFIDSTMVSLSTPFPGVAVRYTLDGTEPSRGSPLFEKAFPVSRTTTIKAAPFRADQPAGPSTEVTVRKLIPRRAVELGETKPGLRCLYYEGEWAKLPNFDSVKAASEIVVDAVVIPSIARPEDYGLVFKGYIRISEDGLYEFAINSDDGSALVVGDSLLCDNDGIHGEDEVTGKIALTAGMHPIEVRMFQGKGGQALKLYLAGPGMPKREVGQSMLSHTPAASVRTRSVR